MSKNYPCCTFCSCSLREDQFGAYCPNEKCDSIDGFSKKDTYFYQSGSSSWVAPAGIGSTYITIGGGGGGKSTPIIYDAGGTGVTGNCNATSIDGYTLNIPTYRGNFINSATTGSTISYSGAGGTGKFMNFGTTGGTISYGGAGGTGNFIINNDINLTSFSKNIKTCCAFCLSYLIEDQFGRLCPNEKCPSINGKNYIHKTKNNNQYIVDIKGGID
jgi:hypothetical protein